MKTLWKRRTPLHPTFERFNNSLAEDWFLLPYELKLQRAHAIALHRCGILSEEELTDLDRALAAVARHHGSAPCPADSDAEDLHTWIECQLTDLTGDVGQKIHAGRSRNDQVATLLKMYVMESGEQLANQLAVLARTCCTRADDWANLVFPLQTHCQFAAPGSVGFWALKYASTLTRTRRLLKLHLSEWRLECPLGSGAVAGTSIPLDRTVQAEELGFAGPARNALDATSTRDECLQFLALTGQVALHLQSLATDIIAFSQTPFSWTKYPPSFGTGSSMMPNKANPDAMELLRGNACAVLAAYSEALLLMKGLPSGYNRDLQCIKPLVRRTHDSVSQMLELADALTGELDFHQDRLRESLALGAIDATLRMEARVRSGQPVRSAHHTVADALDGTCSPASSVQVSSLADQYATIGSASPAETKKMAGEIRGSLESSP